MHPAAEAILLHHAADTTYVADAISLLCSWYNFITL